MLLCYRDHLDKTRVLKDREAVEWMVVGIVHSKCREHIRGIVLRMICPPIEHLCSPCLEEVTVCYSIECIHVYLYAQGMYS